MKNELNLDIKSLLELVGSLPLFTDEFSESNTANLGGAENTTAAREKDSEEKGEDVASISNAVVMQFMQQMQQQMQQQTYQQTQQIESKIDGTTEKIEEVQDNQRILQTRIDETYQKFEGKVDVLEEKVDKAIGQLDAKITALKKEVAKLQTNDATISSIKVKTPLSDARRATAPKFSSPRVGITQSKRNNNSLTIDGKIQSCNYIITLDTGASHSIINSTIVKEKFDPLVGAWFRTATGEEAAIKGKIMRNISISDVSMEHEFLVADIMNEVMLGMDFMAKHGFALDMKRQVLQYANVTLPLTVGYDRQAEVLQVVVQRQQRIPPNSEAIV
uniref:Peptidase A2 domain-containing protein n=1 Tax=Glossina austeni TaxID=7395 RepID=A0A1A9VP62_GLOAU